MVQGKTRADYATTDFRELLRRPEINAAIIATDEHLHVEPILAACERRIDLLIEKPLATELSESQKVLKKITESGVDESVERKFPGAEVTYGSAASGAGDNREIPAKEGGDVHKDTGR